MDGARHSVVAVSHKQAHGQPKTAINLSWGEGVFQWGKKKSHRTWGLRAGWFIKMRKWSSFWICFGSTGGMQRCCLNKAADQCCCRCWRWQSVVIEALLWALSQWCRQSPGRPQTSTQACLLESERGYQGPVTGGQQRHLCYPWYD